MSLVCKQLPGLQCREVGGEAWSGLLTGQPALWSAADCALSSLLIQVLLGCHPTVIPQSQVGFPPNLTFIALIST